MKLYLLRHGDAVNSAVDPLRPLSHEGSREVQRIAGYIKQKGIKTNRIFHSSKKRAQQTAQIIKEAAIPEGELIEKGYLSPNDSIDKITNEIIGMTDDLMIVGHLPFLPCLAAQLVLQDESQCVVNFRTAGLAVLEKNGSNSWKVAWSISPDSV